MSRLARDGTAKLVSRDQILRRERGQGKTHFPCSADHEQDWQPYPVDPYPAIRTRFSLSVENERAYAGRDGRARFLRLILRRERGQGKKYFPCSGDHEQEGQPCPVDPFSAEC